MKRSSSTPPRFTTVSSVTMVDPRVDQRLVRKGEHPRKIIVADLIDRDGRHWRRFGDEPPVLLDA